MNKAAYKNGVEACRAGFERLKAGKPEHPAHIGLPSSKITPGTVSVEAGFDRGYLKKSRQIHIHLIDEINSYRKRLKSDSSTNLTRFTQVLKKSEQKDFEIQYLHDLTQKIIAQNLQLVERVRTLELELKSYRNVQKIQSEP
ncbi:hypothetical protein [Pseudomonas sp. Fl4BN1]|uniref:hypothetical protein n=1 Tax=Pseudomonas sp. Fl4BN1 TaxID=2697651 RepID=UPI0013778DF2|nr:hypothetical protein [Pseudomonas sp. Fl4BN1]NBF12974.1 hypothetical protein [Pseudomonas sp. Fl4BN1]